MTRTAGRGWGASPAPLADGFDLLLLDLDGVVYVGRHVVAGAAQSLARAATAGLTCRFVTNNASRPPQEVAAHLRELGVAAEESDVVTSAQEGAELLASLLEPGAQVLAVGGPGVPAALVEVGLQPVTRYAAGVVGVLQGFGPDVTWRDLAEATYAVQAGAAWVATNPDLTVPTPRGIAPGNGQLTSVVARTTGVTPRVTGKPGAGLFTSAIRRAGGGRALAVGDRLDTDIAGAVAAELPSLLVLTGVSGVREVFGAHPSERPTYVGADLGALWQEHPEVREDAGWWICGTARARVLDDRIEIGAGTDQLELLRVAAAAAWSALDEGLDLDLDAVTVSVRSAAR